LPNKYVFFARASENYINGNLYKFKGSGSLELNFTSLGFRASDELIVVIDNSNVRAYSLTALNEFEDSISLFSNNVINYSDIRDVYYFSDGYLINNFNSYNIQNNIRVFASNGNLIVYQVFICLGHVVCVVLNQGTSNYEFYAFQLNDLNTVIPISTDLVQTNGIDYSPVFYVTSSYIYGTYGLNNSSNVERLSSLSLDLDNYTATFSTEADLGVSFTNDFNSSYYDDKIVKVESNFLVGYDVNNGVVTNYGYFPFDGRFRGINNSLYFIVNNHAVKINI